MPSGNSFFIAALTGYIVLLTLQWAGWRIFRAHWSAFFAKTPGQNVTMYRRIGWSLFFLTAQLPFIYWLFFYKSWQLDVPGWLWNGLWVWGLSLALALTSVFLIQSIYKLWSLFRRKKRLLSPPPAPIVTRRNFLRSGMAAGIGSGTMLSAFSVQDSMEPVIEEVTMSFSALPPAFNGMTIGVLSDIHSSPFMTKKDIERHATALRSLNCDMLLLPGDFINSRTDEVYACAEALAGLSAPLGVWAVTGNHDYFSRQIEKVCYEIEQAGIRCIRNANVNIERNGERISLLGLDDPYANSVGKYLEDGWTYEKGIEAMLENLPSHNFKLLLCHRPYRFEEFARLGIDCMIAGHTHGGQIVLAKYGDWNLSFSRFASPFVAGHYKARRTKETQLYVTRGVGSVGIPLRLNCPPEITKIRLTTV